MMNVFFAPNANPWTSFFEILKSIELVASKENLEIDFITSASNKNTVHQNFLDSEADVHWYYTNLWELLMNAEWIDKILVLDFFTPWLDILKYLLEIKQKKVKLWALLHWWSFLEGDLYRWEWLVQAEKTWGIIYDVIYVPSQYLFEQLPRELKKKAKVFPRGIDYFYDKYLNASIEVKHKEIDVIFPHRLSSDKGVSDFIEIVKSLPDVKFAITSFNEIEDNEDIKTLQQLKNCSYFIGQDDDQHLQTLQKSKIVLSCAYQENFWYSVVKSVLVWAIPIVPQRLVYPEFFSKDFCYQWVVDAIKKIRYFLNPKKDTNIALGDLWKISLMFSQLSFYPLLQDFYEL